jgi:hypothetical protein
MTVFLLTITGTFIAKVIDGYRDAKYKITGQERKILSLAKPKYRKSWHFYIGKIQVVGRKHGLSPNYFCIKLRMDRFY